MANPQKVFSGKTTDAETPPITFNIDLENAAGDHKVVSFEAYGTAPADALLMVGRISRLTRGGEEFMDVSQLGDIMERSLLTESAAAWRAMLDDREWSIRGAMMGEVFAWLQEQWEERPTRRSPISSDGRSPNGTGSTENASSAGSDSKN